MSQPEKNSQWSRLEQLQQQNKSCDIRLQPRVQNKYV